MRWVIALSLIFLVACTANPVPVENVTQCVDDCRAEWKGYNDSDLYWEAYWYVNASNQTLCECYVKEEVD